MTSESCVLVVGAEYATLLRRILQKGHDTVPRIEQAGSDATLIPLAKSWMIVRRTPVAIVMDADTTSAVREREMRLVYEDLLRAAAGGVAFKLVLLMPDLERYVSNILGGKLEAWAMITPKHRWVDKLSEEEISRVADDTIMRELVRFLDNPKPWKPTDASESEPTRR